jgi:hypothetical protein
MSKTPTLTFYEAGDMGKRSMELTHAAWMFYMLNPQMLAKPNNTAQIIRLAYSKDEAVD